MQLELKLYRQGHQTAKKQKSLTAKDTMDPKLIVIAIVVVVGLAVVFWKKKPRPTGFEAKYSPEIADDVCTRLFSDQDPARLKVLFELYSFKFSPMGTFTSQAPPGAALNIAKKIYAADELDNVIAALNRYGPTKKQSEREDMQLHIVKVSNGDASKVGMLVEQANLDYRDVLTAATSPAMFSELQENISILADLSSTGARKLMDSDLQQYVKWLLRYADIDVESATPTSYSSPAPGRTTRGH